jgi:large subunit ribosomal protein L4
MSAKSLTVEDAQSANLVLVGPEKGRQAVHDLVTAYRANRRTGSACTKTRGEVSGNNRKIYKQKGTGGARHGDKRAPIFVGGGVVKASKEEGVIGNVDAQLAEAFAHVGKIEEGGGDTRV